ncbi:hypothetical protein BH20BAC1_BH20BAC1_27350 [soil metagenome]
MCTPNPLLYTKSAVVKFILSAHKLKIQISLLQRITCPVFTGGIADAQCQAKKLALTNLFIYWDNAGPG